jgi:hypothetical protein
VDAAFDLGILKMESDPCMEKAPNRLWMIALLLGWAADFLFWGHPVGVNYAAFLALFLGGATWLLLSLGLRPARASLWLLLPFGFFLAMAVLRREPLSAFLAFVFSLFPLGVLVNTCLGGRWMQYGLLDYLKGGMKILTGLLMLPVEYFIQLRKEWEGQDASRRGIPVAAILRGLLIALPILVIFATLLASADLVFAQKLEDFFLLIDFDSLTDNLDRLVLIVMYAYSFIGIFFLMATHSTDKDLLSETSPIKLRLGFTEASIVLGSVILLFGFFVAIQFRYFFGGDTNIGVAGYTYSSYARRGFNELVTVAFFSLILILGLSALTRREDGRQKRIYSGLNMGIVGLVLVMLFSAYQRLMLAIDWHGYSRLRLYPRVFMIWLGILLLVVLVLEIMDRQRHFAFAAALASLGFALTISLMNVDGAIVHHNVWRAVQGRHFNVSHLASLSSDAVPALADEFLSPSLPTEIREGVGAALVCQRAALEAEAQTDWRAFHGSDWLAERALQDAQGELSGYHYKTIYGLARVRTPGNVVYYCRE